MKRFVFRLESVMKLRRFELDARKRELGAALERSARVERKIEDASKVAAECAADFVAATKQGVKAGRAGIQLLEVEQAFRDWRINQLSLLEAQRLVEEARVEVTRANTKVRALEKLRERALEKYQVETAREETRELDEVAGRTRSLTSRLDTEGAAFDRSAS